VHGDKERPSGLVQVRFLQSVQIGVPCRHDTRLQVIGEHINNERSRLRQILGLRFANNEPTITGERFRHA
jgi:hypothetical protein